METDVFSVPSNASVNTPSTQQWEYGVFCAVSATTVAGKLFSKHSHSRVEAGSNTSTVTLRVVGGDEKGSLKSETVKYGRKSQGTTTGKD
jgi:hypothetical protein